MDDNELLREYVKTGSHAAFGQLVSRHIDMVYAAARRQTRDPATAEDVTQAVFIVLARRAASVRSGAVLPAWLLSTARYAAMNARLAESRRRSHEQRAASMRTESDASPDDAVAADNALSTLL